MQLDNIKVYQAYIYFILNQTTRKFTAENMTSILRVIIILVLHSSSKLLENSLYTFSFCFSHIVVAQTSSSYPLGTVHQVGSSDLNVYDVVGDHESTGNNKVAIIVLYDIRGFDVTNTRLFCERLAHEYKTRVLMPDFFRGTLKDPTRKISIFFENCRSTHSKCNLVSCPTRSGDCQHISQLRKIY
jgi:hypothetical protein